MRFRETLNDVFRTPTRVGVLRLLLRHADVPFTGREVARKLGLSASNVATALRSLQRLGIVRSMVKGKAILYQANRQHILMPSLWALFEFENDLLRSALRELPVEWEAYARSVILYGSVARGEESSDSDVDLCVVTRSSGARRRIERKLEGSHADFYLRTGNRLAPLVLSAPTFCARYRRRDPLILQIAREGRVVFGETLGELLS